MLFDLWTIKGGGGSGLYFGNFNYEIRVQEEGQDTSRLFRVVLGPCAQFYPCEA